MDIKEILKREITSTNRSHAYLFVCQDQDYLVESVNLFIRTSGCLAADVSKISPLLEAGKSGEISVLMIRDFLHDISLSPHGKIRVGIIEHAEKLNNSSANILLKTLEEPPDKVIIILTASCDNILPTIKSRCRTIKVNTESIPRSITFSYQEFINVSIGESFKKIDEIIKSNQSEKLLLDLIQQFEETLVNNLDKRAAGILENIIQSKKRIMGNANPRLTLENLILKIRSQYGG